MKIGCIAERMSKSCFMAFKSLSITLPGCDRSALTYFEMLTCFLKHDLICLLQNPKDLCILNLWCEAGKSTWWKDTGEGCFLYWCLKSISWSGQPFFVWPAPTAAAELPRPRPSACIVMSLSFGVSPTAAPPQRHRVATEVGPPRPATIAPDPERHRVRGRPPVSGCRRHSALSSRPTAAAAPPRPLPAPAPTALALRIGMSSSFFDAAAPSLALSDEVSSAFGVLLLTPKQLSREVPFLHVINNLELLVGKLCVETFQEVLHCLQSLRRRNFRVGFSMT